MASLEKVEEDEEDKDDRNRTQSVSHLVFSFSPGLPSDSEMTTICISPKFYSIIYFSSPSMSGKMLNSYLTFPFMLLLYCSSTHSQFLS